MNFKESNGSTFYPVQGQFTISKSDTVDFDYYIRKIYVGGTGDVVLVNPDGSTVTLKSVPTGALLDCCARRVNSTNTTATLMVGFY